MAYDNQTTLAWLATPEGETTLQALTRLRQTYETARGTNDPRQRDIARTALGGAVCALLEATGATEQLRAQMLEHVLGDRKDGAAYAEKTFTELTRAEMVRTPGGLAVMRGLAERGVLTMFSLFGVKFSAMVVNELRGRAKGHRGVLGFSPKKGKNPDGGLADALQEKTVLALGYTLGSSGGGQLKQALLDQATTFYNSHATIKGVATVRWASVRDWTQRSHANAYRIAVQDGLAHLDARTIDTSRQL